MRCLEKKESIQSMCNSRYLTLNAQRLSLKGVHSSEWKQVPSLVDVDIVYSAWRHAAVHKRTCKELTSLVEYIGPKSMKALYGTGLQEDNPEYVVVYADYAALELKTIMAQLNPKLFMEAHDKMLDPHTLTALKIFKTDKTYEYIFSNNSKERWIGKLLNFLLLYGAGTAVLQQKIMEWMGEYYTDAETQELIDGWFKAFPEMKQWHIGIWKAIKSGKLMETPTGRFIQADRLQDAAGNQNQSTGADVAKLALIEIDKFMDKEIYQPKDGKPIILLSNFVHDSFLFICKNDPSIYKPLCKDLVDAMSTSWNKVQPVFANKGVEMVNTATVGFNSKQADSKGFIYSYEDIGNRQEHLDLERTRQAEARGELDFTNGPVEIVQ